MKIPKISFKNPEFVLLLILFLISAFLRFYKVSDYVVFLGDEGRDMIILKKIIIDHDITFLGPTASVGGFYLGPAYYYLAAPFLALWNLNPVGPSYMVAIFGLATVFVLYKFLKDTTGVWPAFLASVLYSVTPTIVRYSRSSWNPNPLPFFSLLIMYFLYLGIKTNKYYYFLLAGASFGIAIQLHYLAIILVGLSALIVIANVSFKKWPLVLVLGVLGFLITFSPFLLFEIKHNFPNFRTILEFTTRGSTSGFSSYNFFYLILNIGNVFFGHLANIKNQFVTHLSVLMLTMSLIFGFIKFRKERLSRLIYSIAIVWFLFGLLFIRFYRGQLYDYYFGFMFPAPFLALGLSIWLIWKNTIGKIASLVLIIGIMLFFLVNGFYRTPPNRLLNQTETVADVVIRESNNKDYNFALISGHNSDHAYKYYLDIKSHKPTDLETEITEQLIVVCESKECSPLGYPTWEIAGFGRAEVENVVDLRDYGIKVIKLKHWPGEPSPAGRPAKKG